MDRDGPFARQFGHAAPMQILHHQYSAYLELAVDPSARRQAYRALFHNVLDEKLLARIRWSTHACGVIGDHRFKEQIEAMLGRAVPTGRRGRPRLGN
jgi:putative transposase